MRWVALLAGLILVRASAAELEVTLGAGERGSVFHAGSVDDSDLANPAGYFVAEPPVDHVVHEITLENVGSEVIADPEVRLNGRLLVPRGDPLELLGTARGVDLRDLYEAWRERRIHGDTGFLASRDPGEILRTLGAAHCGEETPAFAAMVKLAGGEARSARIVGHVAAEYRLGGSWMLLDTDQNALYLRWDNETPAAEADLMGDPLLVFRTKVYGRQATWEAPSAWLNTARFKRGRKPGRQKDVAPAHPPVPTAKWEFWPGERIVLRPHEPPAEILGTSPARRGEHKLRRIVATADYVVSDRRPLPARSPFALAEPVDREPGYAVSRSGLARAQVAAKAVPVLRRGHNELWFGGPGRVRVRFGLREVARTVPASPTARQQGTAAEFVLEGAEGGEVLWWQISPTEDFRHVPPNFDQVSRLALKVVPGGSLDETFFSPGKPQFFRARVRRTGVWSPWSKALRFTVAKPNRPDGVRAQRTRHGAMVRWNPAAGEMMIFGSDRVDFVPEVYGVPEALRLRAGALLESRPSRNLLATVDAARGEAVVPLRAAYRLILRDAAGVRSVPSDLLRLAGVPAHVLQNEHVIVEPGGGKEDVCREMPLWEAPPAP